MERYMGNPFIRKPAVAGSFYPRESQALTAMVKGFCPDIEKKAVSACICPHAGYIYSGAVAGAVYAEIDIPNTVILLGPNHTGMGAPTAVMKSGVWEVPTGRAVIDEALATAVIASSPLFTADDRAHIEEHSLEVQLPFLLYRNSGVRIVPITLMGSRFESALEMGEALAEVLADYGSPVLVAVSSDMNHYESEAVTRQKDSLAIEKVLELDAEGLLDVTKEKNITMCGVFPTAIALIAMKKLGCHRANLVKRSTSGPTSGDMDHVVGYAGFTISGGD